MDHQKLGHFFSRLRCFLSYHISSVIRAGRVAQWVGHLTRESGVLGSIPGLATYFRFSFRFFKKGSCQLLAKVCVLVNHLGGYPVWQHTFVSPSAFSRRTVVSYRQKYVREVLVNCLGGLSLPRKSVTVPT